MSNARQRTVPYVLACCLALVLALTGCDVPPAPSATGAGPAPTRIPAAQVAELAAAVPASLKSAGKITVAVSNYPPAAYQDASGALTGWDVELVRAIGETLGLPVEFSLVDFASIVPGLQAGRYTMGSGDISVTAERIKVAEFVATHQAYDVFVAAAGSPLKDLKSLEDVCGKKLALLVGGVEVGHATEAQPKCAAAGKPPIDVQQFPSQPELSLALSSGRVDVEAVASDAAAYLLQQQPDKFAIVGRYGDNQLTGIAIARNADSKALADLVAKVVAHLVDTGEYQRIFDTYNGGLGTIGKELITVNPTVTVLPAT